MQCTAVPFIARLRRRLVASVWLFALLMLAKSAAATSCLTDGIATVAAVAGVSASAAADDGAALIVADDGDSAPCWHGGAAGCHCSCAHGVALPVVSDAFGSIIASSSPLRFDRARFASSPQKTALRPPIS